MASSLLLLLDDIASMMDDVALMSKMAAKKTAGVLGDDLALNAQQVSGVRAEKELPIVWSVAKGSFVNKLILVPLALFISWIAPWLINPLLVVGGLFLCYEGVEKVLHSMMHKKSTEHTVIEKQQNMSLQDIEAMEKEKIKGAIRTDFILSAEIVVITLGTVALASFATKLTVLSLIALGMTIGVYGLVALIVKLDDIGLHLSEQPEAWKQSFGRGLLAFAPILMKTLSIVGTLAMFLVGGGILVHAVPYFHHLSEGAVGSIETIPSIGHFIGAVTPTLINFVIGFIAGLVVLAIVKLIQQLRLKKQA